MFPLMPATYRSPITLCLFRRGLASGVCSRPRCRPSNSSSARVSKFASIASEAALCIEGGPSASRCRLCISVGGVFDSGGERRVGVWRPSVLCWLRDAAESMCSSAMAMFVLRWVSDYMMEVGVRRGVFNGQVKVSWPSP
jgi:hypothetical protein